MSQISNTDFKKTASVVGNMIGDTVSITFKYTIIYISIFFLILFTLIFVLTYKSSEGLNFGGWFLISLIVSSLSSIIVNYYQITQLKKNLANINK